MFVGLVLKKSFLVLGRPNCFVVVTALMLVLKWLLPLDPESMFNGFVNVPFLNKLLFSILSKLYRGVGLIRTMEIVKKSSELARSFELAPPCGLKVLT